MDHDMRKNDSIDGFVNTPFFESIIERTLQYMNAGYPVHFVGPSGVGKTSLAMHIARKFNRPVTIIRGHHEMDNKDLLGQHYGIVKKEVIDNYIHSVYKKEQEIKPLWVNGELIEAVKNGHVVIYDEFTPSRPETNNIFLSLLEEKVLPVYGKGKESFIKCHPEFSILFTSNPDEYAGTFHTQDALKDRLITINLDHCDEETEISILSVKTELVKRDAAKIVKLMSNLRVQGDGFTPSLRSSIMIASLAKKYSIPIHQKNKKYQTLCFDVLSRPIKQILPNLSYASIRELIIKEMSRKDESK